jgi:TP901 family phage tail tape measure protein
MMDVARLGLEVDSRDVKSATTELERLNKQAGDTERSATRFAQNFGRTMKQGAMVAGAAFAAAGTGIAYGVNRILNSADELAKMSQRIGISVEELSRLRHAADLSGVSFEGMTSAVRLLSRNMDEAFTSGTGQAADAFARLGVELADADGKLRSNSDVMAEVADRFADMEDGAEKTALAMQIFGRSGTDLIPMLNQGADALQRMKDEADELGLVITPEMAANAEMFNDNLTRLQGVMTGLLTMVAADLAPVLAEFTTWLVDMAKGFSDMDPWMQSAVTRFGVFAAVLAPLGAVLAVVVAGIAAIGLPVALAAAGIIALTAAVVAFWPEIQRAGEAVAAFVSDAWARFEAAWDGIVGQVDGAKAAVLAFASEMLDAFLALPGQMIQIGIDIMQGLIDGIKSMGGQVIDSMMAPVRDGVNSVKSWLGIQSPSRLMHEVGTNIMQGLGDGMDSMRGSIQGSTDSIVQGIAGAFQSLGSSIAGAIQGTREWKDVALDAVRSVGRAILSNMNFGGGMFGNIFKSLLGGFLGFEGGGYTGAGAASQPAGIVHAGEYVMSKPAVDQLGVGYLDALHSAAKGYKNGGYVTPYRSGGYVTPMRNAANDQPQRVHVDVRAYVDDDGNWQAEVERVAQPVAAQAAGAVARAVPSMVDARNGEREARRIRPRSPS